MIAKTGQCSTGFTEFYPSLTALYPHQQNNGGINQPEEIIMIQRRLPQLRPALIAALIACSLPLAMPAHAEGPPTAAAGASHHMGMPLPPFMHGIELSEAQQDKLFAIMHAAAPSLRQQFKKLKNAEEQLQTLAQNQDSSNAALQSQADKLAKAQSEILLAHLQTERQIFTVLTAAQQQQARQQQQKMQMRPHLQPHLPPPEIFAGRQQLPECASGKRSPSPKND